MADTVLEFAESLNQNTLHSSTLPCFEALPAEQPDLNNADLPSASQPQQFQPMVPVPQQTQPSAVKSQQAQQMVAVSQQAQLMAIESQQAQPMAIESQQAQPMAIDSQQAQAVTVGSQQVQPQADENNTQTADMTQLQVPEVPMQDLQTVPRPVEQGQAAGSHLRSYEQDSHDPGSGHFGDS